MQDLQERTERIGRSRRGRPPSELAHHAVLDAAQQFLVEHDFGQLNLEQIAAQAGVGKATIYRHWPTREALALEILLRMVGEMAPARDRGSARKELISIVAGTLRTLTETQLGLVIEHLFSELALNPAIAEPFRKGVVHARRACIEEVFTRGMQRGEIRLDADVDLATELLVGPLYYRLLFGGGFPSDFAPRVVDAVLRGYGAAGRPRTSNSNP